jgi:ribonuclease BN (tRNA processing enzyme)
MKRSMEMMIIGIGDAFTRRSFGSSAVIRTVQGAHVLIDCPDLIHRAIHEAAGQAGWSLDASKIDDVLLTHLHGDHCNGLESFGFYRRLMKMRDPSCTVPRLHVTDAVAARLWERLGPAMHAPMGNDRPSHLSDYFDVRILDPAQAMTVAGLSVRCRSTGHPVPTVGFLISDGALTLGWSGDTPFERAHVDWLSQADIIVHESNLGASHTPIEALNSLPDHVRRKLRLIHLVDDFDPRQTDIAILREGDVLG